MKKYFLWLFSTALIFNVLFTYNIHSSVNANATFDEPVQYLVDNYANASKSDKDWAAIALSAFGRSVSVSETSSTSVLSLSRVALAKNAQNISTKTEVEKIISIYSGSYFGSANLVNDDIFAVLAIATYDKQWLDDHPQVFKEIADSQKPNGSFSYSKSDSGDTDMTAAAIWALSLSDGYSSQISDGISYVLSAQNEDGGFGYKAGAPSNVASTSWAAVGLNASNKPSASAKKYILDSLHADGAWYIGDKASVRSTAYALIALSNISIPKKVSYLPLLTDSTDGREGGAKKEVGSPSNKDAPTDNPAVSSNNKDKPKESLSTNRKKVIKRIVIIRKRAVCKTSSSASASASSSNGKSKAVSTAVVETACW